MAFGQLGAGFSRLGALSPPPPAATTPASDGSMDFSIATGDNTALLALLEDI